MLFKWFGTICIIAIIVYQISLNIALCFEYKQQNMQGRTVKPKIWKDLSLHIRSVK